MTYVESKICNQKNAMNGTKIVATS